jgi:mRNA interferase MazF
MARVLRGEIRWARVGHAPSPPGRATGAGSGTHEERPVLILSADVFNERSGTAIVAAVSSREPAAEFPLSQPLSSRSLPRRSWIVTSQVRTIATDRLGGRVGRASAEELELALEGLREIIDG